MTADHRAALVEKMARAMERADSHAYEYCLTSSWEHLAEAAIDIVLEEAAQVADWPYPASEGWGEEMAGRIAAAEDIRALKET